MTWSQFKTRVPGKLVLTGEHAVLKGIQAVALPYSEMGLEIFFDPNSEFNVLKVTPSDAEALILDLLKTTAKVQVPQGVLEIKSSIPIGAGLGSSAALCVALTHWLAEPLSISSDRGVEFATQLEHRFHGKSSGMDVAAIFAGEPISFVMGQGGTPIGVKKLPRLTLHDTGLRSRTSDCVQKVNEFRAKSPVYAAQVDEAMGDASQVVIRGLLEYEAGNIQEGLELIKRGVHQAGECFYAWDLVPSSARRLENDLLRQGALAVKMTGAGDGGMMLALWK